MVDLLASLKKGHEKKKIQRYVDGNKPRKSRKRKFSEPDFLLAWESEEVKQELLESWAVLTLRFLSYDMELQSQAKV